MKHWYLVPLAAIVGLIAGSWGPREDAARLKAIGADPEILKPRAKESAVSGFETFTRLAQIPEVADAPKPKEDVSPESSAEAEPTEGEPTEAEAEPAEEASEPISREDLAARLELAAELWETRVELARVQWKERLEITEPEASAAFDRAIETMNARLKDSMAALAEEIALAGKMNAELGLRLMGDLAQSMAETYDEIGASLPPEKRAALAEMPVYEFIDPKVGEPLIGVQDKLERGF